MRNEAIGYQTLFLEDILHTGHHGPEGESKVGEKYDKRRGHVTMFYEDGLCDRMSVTLLHFTWDEEDGCYYLCRRTHTTPFEVLYTENGYTMLRTLNSIYKFRELTDEEIERLGLLDNEEKFMI